MVNAWSLLFAGLGASARLLRCGNERVKIVGGPPRLAELERENRELRLRMRSCVRRRLSSLRSSTALPMTGSSTESTNPATRWLSLPLCIVYSSEEPRLVAQELNDRPRKRLAFKKPIELIGHVLLRW